MATGYFSRNKQKQYICCTDQKEIHKLDDITENDRTFEDLFKSIGEAVVASTLIVAYGKLCESFYTYLTISAIVFIILTSYLEYFPHWTKQNKENLSVKLVSTKDMIHTKCCGTKKRKPKVSIIATKLRRRRMVRCETN